MKKYIAEIAGKDSVSAVIKFMKENPGTVVIPTIVYTGTEYGDRESYYNSVRFLKDKSKESGVMWEDTIELTDGDFWNVLCARYQYMINQKYGFYTPCIACHLFAHLMRLPLLKKVGAEGIITGERHSHQGKLKANQHPMTIECFNNIFEKNGIRMIRPLVDISDTQVVNGYIGDRDIIAHANDIKCVLSGNLRGFDLDKNLQGLKRYLDEFLFPVGNWCAEEMLKDSGNAADGSDLPEKLEKKIKEVLA